MVWRGLSFSLFVVVLLLITAPSNALHAQPADSTWSDDSVSTWDDLGLDTLDFPYEDIIGHVSTGWFPQPYFATSLSLGSLMFGDMFDRGSNLRSKAFVPTAAPFGWRNPYTDDEREILQPGSNEEEDDGYPLTSYSEYSLTYLVNPPFPAILRLGAGLRISEGLLFSSDTSRSYLGLNGVPQPLKEVGVIDLKEYSIAGTAGLEIPIYGAFIDNDIVTLSSYYFLFGGVTATYAVSSEATQYSQIANAKGELRYKNATDTVRMFHERELEGLNKLRLGYEIGIGWRFAAENFVFGFEPYMTIPITPVVKDAEWRQYPLAIRFSIGYQWLPSDTSSTP